MNDQVKPYLQGETLNFRLHRSCNTFWGGGLPCDQLDKVIIEGNASTGIKDGWTHIPIEVRGHHLHTEGSYKTVRWETLVTTLTQLMCIPGARCIPECLSWVHQLQPWPPSWSHHTLPTVSKPDMKKPTGQSSHLHCTHRISQSNCR